MHTARCNCGAVHVTVTAEMTAPNACHCTLCRRQSGHIWASAEFARDQVTITGAQNLTWYQATERVRRGFCKTCGCYLFFEGLHDDWIAIAMGAFDAPTQTTLARHIYTDDKGDYYTLADGLPQRAQ